MDLEEIQQATHHLRPIMLDRSCSPAARFRQRRARGVRIGLRWAHAGVADRDRIRLLSGGEDEAEEIQACADLAVVGAPQRYQP